ncbi:integrase arm-type DNA-binding domain-containing protein [Algiphilus sp.]|uniref:tyrosine-type recombinase/integrase n=1 Tax=Algiphilus sp. TaxID=1872431 RepID=UPI0032ECCCB3
MKLTDSAVRNAKPADKTQKLFDGGGLFLEVTQKGSKRWRWKYRYGGKEKLLSMGVYPVTGLKEARERRNEARKQLAEGKDPSALRKAEATAKAVRAADSFEALALEWMKQKRERWIPAHQEKVARRFEVHVFPWLGRRPVAEIGAPELLQVLRRIESTGNVDTARRVLQSCGHVFRYAIATGRAERDPSGDLRGALKAPKDRHYASLTDPAKVGGLLRAIDGYSGDFTTKCALRLAPLVFVRPGELRAAEWWEFDLDNAEWRIAAERMKMRSPHIVPLSRQAVAILRDLHPLTGGGTLVFPGVRSPLRPMSENTVNAALRRLGYTTQEMTGHGFRSMASTLLNEMGWHRDAIERQLAHAERNAVRAAYNYAEYLPERRRMMQAWADYLDALREGSTKVTPIRAA